MRDKHGVGRTITWTTLAWVALSAISMAAPAAGASAAFNLYAERLEARLRQQHGSGGMIAPVSPEQAARLRRGELVIEQLASHGASPAGAMLHHWRGTAFVSGAHASDIERLTRDFTGYPQRYRPQVVAARVLSRSGDRYETMLRVRQHHVITVVMDTGYAVEFGRPDDRQGFSSSRSTRITEIANAGTQRERAFGDDEEHGFLWRLNTYWSWAEADGGLYMQIESVSLTRDIPHGLGWIAGPFVESIPRESLEFTLNATRDALRNAQQRGR